MGLGSWLLFVIYGFHCLCGWVWALLVLFSFRLRWLSYFRFCLVLSCSCIRVRVCLFLLVLLCMIITLDFKFVWVFGCGFFSWFGFTGLLWVRTGCCRLTCLGLAPLVLLGGLWFACGFAWLVD